MMKRICLLLGVSVLVTNATASTDPFVGKWILNVQRSKYPVGTCPKYMSIEMDTNGRGIHYQSEVKYSNGATVHARYTADYNGKQAIVMGDRGMLLPVFLKRTDSRTVVASYTRSLRIVATSRRVVSRDGRTMTISTTSRDESGNRVTAIGVYEKQ